MYSQRIMMLIIFGLSLVFAAKGSAQTNPPSAEMGVCDGQICGPSAGFTVETFPTIAKIDFTAFPPNPTRPYQPEAGGRLWYVATNGEDNADGTETDPLRSPEMALKLAQSGDVIWVKDGEYRIGGEEYEALHLTTPNLVLAAVNVGKVVFTPAHEANAVGIAAIADNLVVDGFVLHGFRSYGLYFGRLDTSQQNLVLKHLMIEGTEDALRSVIVPQTPHSQPVIEGLLLYDVWIRGATNIGFNCGEGPCHDVRLEAIQVMMAGEGEGSGADGIAIESGQNIVAFNLEVIGASADGLDFKTEQTAVVNVVVHDVGRNGIKLWQGGDVINALVYNTGADAAIVFEYGNDYRILNSLIARHAWPERAYAASVAYDHPDEPGTLQVINTVFFENTGALWVSPAFDLTLHHSLFYGWRGGMVEWGDLAVGTVADGYAPFQALEEAGRRYANWSELDPRFADPDTGDYRFLTDSPARDSGTDAVEAFIPFDLYGNPRLAGDGVDLGPIEANPEHP
jgi:hypothetical protein